MNSIPFLDERYPVKTVCTDNADCQRSVGWHHLDTRNAMLQDYLDVPLKQVIYACETHSGSVLAISGENGASLERVEEANALGPSGGYDAMVTNVPGILLCIWTSDCLPLFLFDPENNIAAIAHCGWRGICDGIASNTVSVMSECFCVNPKNILTVFGPGICGKCYKVGGELIEAFSRRFPSEEVRDFFCPNQDGEYLLDLRGAIAFDLSRMGVRPENIHDVGICSYESEDYSSYRRSGESWVSKLTLSGIVVIEQ